MKKPTKKSVAALADARRRYDEGEPLAALAASLKISSSAFLRLRRRENWPSRSSPGRSKLDEPKPDEPEPQAELAAAPPASHSGPVDMEALRRRLERAVEAELTCVEARLSGQSVAMGERNARLLASLVKTFAELRRFAAAARSKPGAGDDSVENDEPAPRDIAVLREELARHVERIARE